MKIRIEAELEYDADIMHGYNAEDKEWFYNLLKTDTLLLYSNEIGDMIGEVRILKVH